MTRIRSFLSAAVAAVAIAASGTAVAAPCGGFVDVDDTVVGAGLCANVEWIKNRAITTNCVTGPTFFCPNDPVNRLVMAAFLNRLGTALTPIEMTPVSAAPAVVTPLSGPVLCATTDFVTPATHPYPRRAYVSGAAHLSAPTANIDVLAQAVYSTNSGATWVPIQNSNQYATLYTGASPGNHVTLAPFGYVDVPVGQAMRFAVQLAQFAGSGNVTAGCQNLVRIANRNPLTSPFDPAAAPVGRSAHGN